MEVFLATALEMDSARSAYEGRKEGRKEERRRLANEEANQRPRTSPSPGSLKILLQARKHAR